MNISDLNQTFTTACTNGDLDVVTDLYNRYYVEKSKFSKFIGFLKLNSVLNLHWDDDRPIIGDCLGGQYDIINFLLSDKKFKKEIQQNDRLASGLHLAMGAGDLEIVELILPILRENKSCYDRIYSGFTNACRSGHLNIVRYMTTQSIFDLEKFDKKQSGYSSYSMKCKGFMGACENGHIDIVRYLTSSSDLKRTVDLEEINTVVRIDSFEIMKYFILDLNLKQNNSFMMRINKSYELDKYCLNLFEKKKAYKQLAKELKQPIDTKVRNKRIKL